MLGEQSFGKGQAGNEAGSRRCLPGDGINRYFSFIHSSSAMNCEKLLLVAKQKILGVSVWGKSDKMIRLKRTGIYSLSAGRVVVLFARSLRVEPGSNHEELQGTQDPQGEQPILWTKKIKERDVICVRPGVEPRAPDILHQTAEAENPHQRKCWQIFHLRKKK